MQTISLTITGMSCGACQAHVTRALESAKGVQNVEVDLPGQSATVQGSGIDEKELIAAVEEEGYGAQLR